MVGEFEEVYESGRLDPRQICCRFVGFFHATIHHPLQNGRGLGNEGLVDLEDLLLGADSKGEEVAIRIAGCSCQCDATQLPSILTYIADAIALLSLAMAMLDSLRKESVC